MARGPEMETPAGTLGCFSAGLLLSASVLALWLPHGTQAALRIQKIPEHPQKNQDLLLSVQGVPSTFQDFMWYLGEEADGGTRLFTYIPGLQRPQRDGSAMGQRDIVGFPNGSMLLRRAQPSDSGTYQVAIAVNPAWTLRAKTKVRVAKRQEDLPTATTHLSMSPGVMVAAIVGPLAAGALLVSSITCLLVLRDRRGPSSRATTTGKPELSPHPDPGDNIYEVMPSRHPLGSPASDAGPVNSATPPSVPPPLPPEPENHHYQDLLNPDSAPYCQLVPTSS
ncbi:carcinoembryonic antigen-related cell adhesion molecule 19 [Cavia porcellus]|uniref:carcinoembryonic antigen-related cell adhesion molecule 19 n=1 Tax=Cavia porcellus TaxID=10141 RepID=UPI002FE0756F